LSQSINAIGQAIYGSGVGRSLSFQPGQGLGVCLLLNRSGCEDCFYSV
jgi:hypothetical protein